MGKTKPCEVKRFLQHSTVRKKSEIFAKNLGSKEAASIWEQRVTDHGPLATSLLTNFF